MKIKFLLHAAVLSVPLTMPITAATPFNRPLYFADKKISDDALHDMVMRRLADDADVKGGGLDIEVKDGVVTLRGKLESQKQIQKAEKLARKVNGVKKVVNEIALAKK